MNNTPLRIGVDMAATAGKKSGLGFYVENVVNAMKTLPGDHEIIEINRVKQQLNTPKRILWDQVGLPLTALTKKIDVLWTPAFSAPRFPKPTVMTAHDIYGVLYPDAFSGPAKRYWTQTIPNSMKRADHLVCISDYTKQTIQTELGVAEENMTVVPNAVGEEFTVLKSEEELQQVETHLQQLGVSTPFILTVGTVEPRKNYERLVDAFVFANRKAMTNRPGTESAQTPPVQLVIVGKKGWEYEAVFQKIKKYHLDNAIVWLDYVNQEQLVSLYNACLFFVMPSIFEGFGMPPLEAMSCGAPVAVAQNTSMPEVVGDAGILFDPFDVDNIRDRINLLLSNADLRRSLSQKSINRAQQFTWEETAKQTLAVLRAAAQQ